MIRTRDIEIAYGRAFAKAYLWLFKVSLLPGGGCCTHVCTSRASCGGRTAEL